MKNLCASYINGVVRAVEMNTNSDKQRTNYYPLLLFEKVIEFINMVDRQYPWRRPENRKYLSEMLDCVAEILMWTKDEVGLKDTTEMLERKYHPLASELISHKYTLLMLVQW